MPGRPLRDRGLTEPETVRLSARAPHRAWQTALPTPASHLIEPSWSWSPSWWMTGTLPMRRAPWPPMDEPRTFMAKGDRRGAWVNWQSAREPGEPRRFQVYRDAVALKPTR